jgi:hypothetical protein
MVIQMNANWRSIAGVMASESSLTSGSIMIVNLLRAGGQS